MILLTLVVLPFVGSLIAACLPADARNREAWLSGFIALLGLSLTLLQFAVVASGEVLHARIGWLPAYGLDLHLRMDGLAWLFAVLVQGIGLLVVLYARYYMSPKDPVPRFFSFLLAFMGSMLGVVLSGNLVQLVVFWELTSLTSFLLIGYWHHRVDARRGARMAFTITAAGGLCLLAGVLLVGRIVGSYDLDTVLASGDLIRGSSLYRPVLVLIALGALTKSAQFPFQFWLPHAMVAPTPVSAYLHSATMVKAGVFLLMRLWPVLSGTPEWVWLIAGAGLVTLLIGSFFAIFQHDLKGLLAYSTISHLGLITLLLGMGTKLGVVAAIFHTLNHAIFKASLFMAAGIIDHESGTRDMRVLQGLYRALPITATLAIVASASMAGVPLLNGFLSKEMFFAETLQFGGPNQRWMSLAAVMMGIFSVTYSLRFISVFFGKLPDTLPSRPHEPPRWMRFPVELLVLLCLVVGTVPAVSVSPLLESAVTSVLRGEAPEYSLALWHGLNLPLLMSFVALAGGVVLYTLLQRYYNLNDCSRVPLFHRINGARAYTAAMLRLSLSAEWLLRRLGTVRLQKQLLWVMVVFAGFLLAVGGGLLPAVGYSTQPFDLWLALLWFIGGASAIAAAWLAKYHRLTALIMVGGAGIITSVTFLWLSAPDLALTQLMVETVTAVLILLGLRWLPPRVAPRSQDVSTPPLAWVRRSRDMTVAVVTGLLMAAASFAVMVRPTTDTVANFFLSKSLPEGGGTNVVNVILVDFRALDTLGEVSVLAIVALTVYALLRRFRPARESASTPPQQTNPLDPATRQSVVQHASSGYLFVPGVYVRFLLPFMVMVSAYFFLRGHNLPGGGFVAGLVFAVGIIVQYMLAGTDWVEARFRLAAHKWLACGLSVAGATGAGAWLLGYPFLTSHTAHLNLPVLGELHVPSAFLFDLGVFLVVVGSTILILAALSRLSIRGNRLPEAGSGHTIEIQGSRS